MKRNKRQKEQWFIKVRGSYLPQRWQAWLLYVPFTAFLILVMVSAFRSQDSLSDIFYMIFPQWVAAAVVMTWIAARKS